MAKKIILHVFACLSLLWIASGGLLNYPIAIDTDAQFLETSVIAAQNIILVPEDYPKIQDAINAANPDAIIQVKAGIYYEMLFVGKPLTIMGENKNTTIIVGRIKVFSNHVIVKGFTIRNAPTLFCGITVYSNSNVISENIIKDNGEDGIWLWYNTNNNTISDNLIEGNTFCGMSLDNSTNNMITGNVITNHEHGLMLTNSENNTITGNAFVTNSHCGFHVRLSSNNLIYHNNFINSPVHSDNSTNTWDNGAEGNYWSDYDGTGSYVIDENNQDRYPLSNPYDKTKPIANAGPDQLVVNGTTVTFDGTGSTDNLGIVNYTWTFIDNTPKTLTGICPSYTFNTPGNYTVTLKVIDAVGNYDTDTVTIRVLDVPEAFPWWNIGLIVAAVGGITLLAVIFWRRKTRQNSPRTRARSSKR